LSAPDRLAEAWAVLGAAAAREATIRVEPAGVAVPDGDVLAGLDVDGGRHLLIPVVPLTGFREDRRSAGVQIRRTVLEDAGVGRHFVDVICLVPRLNDLFAQVAADMLQALLLDPGDPPRACHEILERWRELLEKPDPQLLGPKQLAGLFGELLVVKELVQRNPANGIDAWTGPSRSQHDFTRGSLAIEVKTTTVREGRMVEIHGAEQLERPDGGELLLCFVRLDVEPDGTSVPELVDSVLALGIERRTFLDLLARGGYEPSRAAEYQRPRFVIRERSFYQVTQDFPQITASSFRAGAVPPGVLRIRYDVDLTGEPPYPLDDAAIERALLMLAAAG
jgi:Putative  PD-(D/E)XK family member, (DUF4420)